MHHRFLRGRCLCLRLLEVIHQLYRLSSPHSGVLLSGAFNSSSFKILPHIIKMSFQHLLHDDVASLEAASAVCPEDDCHQLHRVLRQALRSSRNSKAGMVVEHIKIMHVKACVYGLCERVSVVPGHLICNNASACLSSFLALLSFFQDSSTPRN